MEDHMKAMRLFPVITCFLFLPGAAERTAFSTNSAVRLLKPIPTESRTQADIIARWKQAKPTFTGNPYLELPSLAPPHSPGKLDPDFLNDGLKMLNFIRYLAGIPDAVTLNASLNETCQNACVLMAATRKIAHAIGKPANMSASFHTKAAVGLRRSNLRYAGKPITLDRAVRDWTDDSDRSNIDRLGHRSGILTYLMRKTGFGMAGQYSAVDVRDYEVSGAVTWPEHHEFMCWPAAGYFPVQMMHRGTAWKITLRFNFDPVSKPFSKYSLTLKRMNDGRIWKFSEGDTKYTRDGNYISSYVGPVFIFRPDASFTCNPGDIYEVSLKGLELKPGEHAEIRYQVKLFSLPE